MISKANYTALTIVDALPGKRYLEDERPAGISPDREKYLVKLQLLETRTIVPPGKEEAYPGGYVGYYLTPKGEDEISSFKEQNRQIHTEAETQKKKPKTLYETITQIIIPITAIVVPAIIALFFQ